MKLNKPILTAISLSIFALFCIGCSSSASLFTDNSSYHEAKNQWNGPLLLPTVLPTNTEITSMKYLTKLKTFEVKMNNLYMFETKTNEKTLSYLTHDQTVGKSIDDMIEIVKQENGHVSPNNGIVQIEKIKINDGTAYWYVIQTHDGKRQVAEFLQNGIRVYLETDLVGDISKEEFLKIANRFQLDK